MARIKIVPMSTAHTMQIVVMVYMVTTADKMSIAAMMSIIDMMAMAMEVQSRRDRECKLLSLNLIFPTVPTSFTAHDGSYSSCLLVLPKLIHA